MGMKNSDFKSCEFCSKNLQKYSFSSANSRGLNPHIFIETVSSPVSAVTWPSALVFLACVPSGSNLSVRQHLQGSRWRSPCTHRGRLIRIQRAYCAERIRPSNNPATRTVNVRPARESPGPVKIVAVDHGKRLVNGVGGHQNSVPRSPRLGVAGRTSNPGGSWSSS